MAFKPWLSSSSRGFLERIFQGWGPDSRMFLQRTVASDAHCWLRTTESCLYVVFGLLGIILLPSLVLSPDAVRAEHTRSLGDGDATPVLRPSLAL